MFLWYTGAFFIIILLEAVLVLSCFLFAFLAYKTISGPKSAKFKFGVVRNSKGVPVKDFIVVIKEPEFGRYISKRVTNELGKYSFALPGGKYIIDTLSSNYVITDDKESLELDLNSIENELNVVARDLNVKEIKAS